MEKEKKQNLLIIISSIILVLLTAIVVYLIFFNKKEELKPVDSNPPSSNQSGELYHIVDGEKFFIYGRLEDGTLVNKGIEISFAYPVIDIDTEEVKAINKKIYDEYQNNYKMNFAYEATKDSCVAIKKNNKYYGTEHIIYDTYRVSQNSDYLSIVIIHHGYTECASGGLSYTGYVINKKTKNVMSNAEIVKMFNADEMKIVNEYNKNLNVLGLKEAKTIDDVELLIYDNSLMIEQHLGDGSDLIKYNNGKFELVSD